MGSGIANLGLTSLAETYRRLEGEQQDPARPSKTKQTLCCQAAGIPASVCSPMVGRAARLDGRRVSSLVESLACPGHRSAGEVAGVPASVRLKAVVVPRGSDAQPVRVARRAALAGLHQFLAALAVVGVVAGSSTWEPRSRHNLRHEQQSATQADT